MRNRRYNYEPQVVDPGAIDFGSIQMYNPEDTARLAQVGQGMQQRWDASQSVIAKQLEEIGAANINPRYKAEVVGKLEEDLDNVYSNVNTTYQGDFGRAYNDITKSLSKSRALLHSATQASAEESKFRDQYNQLAMQGLAPRVINRTEQGLTPQTLSFEDYYQLPESVFDESGKFVAPQFGALRSAGKHENWLAQNVSDAINRAVDEEDPTLLTGDLAGMAKAVTTGGMSDTDVESYINKNPWIIENFVANSPFAKEEFSDGKGGIRMDDAKEYVTNIVKGQTSQQIKKQFIGSPSDGSSSNKSSSNKSSPELKIFGEDFRTRIEKNPFVEEVGSYKQALNPSTWDNFIGSFTGNRELVKFKGGVKDINHAISTLKGVIRDGKNNMDKKDLNKIKSQLVKYESIKDDLDSAEETLRNRLSHQNYGQDYYSLSAENRKLVDSKIPSGSMELADLLDSDNQILANASSTSRTILHPVTQKMIKQEIMAKIEDMNFSTTTGAVSSYFNDVVISLGVAPGRARQYLAKNNVIPSYHKSRGQYYIDIPTNLDEKGEPDSENPKYKKLYFDLDESSSSVIQGLSRAILNNSKEPVIISDNRRFTFKYEPSLNRDKRNKAEKKIQVLDLYGNPVQGNDGKDYYIGLETLQDWMQDYQTNLLASKYTLPFMNTSDQRSNPEIVD